MATTGPLSHIDISVGYPERSVAFYHAFLTALGFRRWRVAAPEWSGDHPTRATWGKYYGDGSRFDIEVRPAAVEHRDHRYDRYRPGPHHLAFHAESDAHVDLVHAAVVAAGGEVLDAPKNYQGQAGYGEYYYAAFFADPDGVKLEVCYVPSANP
jgi:catechol 2,3-dioxygenase-like lactoylglutathione lyase family enzyme